MLHRGSSPDDAIPEVRAVFESSPRKGIIRQAG